MTFNEKLEICELNAAGEVVPLLNLNDGTNYMMETGSFEVIAPEATPVLAEDQRRWGGSREVGEVHANGSVEWVAGVTATTEQQALEKVETLLARLAANPYHAFLLWQVPGASHPTLYEMRGTGTWAAKYSVAQVEGAQLFLFTIHIPVGPLALGLPVNILSTGPTSLPAVFALTNIPGDAPAKAEVVIGTGENATELLTAQRQPNGVAVDATFIYWCDKEKGFVARAKLNGTSVEKEWIKTEGKPAYLAVDAGHVYWSDESTGDIGRATIAGATVEKTWISGLTAPAGVAVNATNIFWGSSLNTSIGRATIAGGTVEKEWLKSANAQQGIAINSGFVYWSNTVTEAVSRATLAGASVEPSWLPVPDIVGPIAVNSESVYWVAGTPVNSVGRANVDGTNVAGTWQRPGGGTPSGLAANSEFVYISNGIVSPSGVIYRAKVTPGAVWGLLGWTAKPSSGLASAPFGVLAPSAASNLRNLVYEAVTGAEGGSALASSNARISAAWAVDPATMTPDSFSNEVAIEVWAHVLANSALDSAQLTLSARPQDGLGYGAPRYSDEWGSGGAPLVLPSEGAKWRDVRLGVIHMLVNTLAPRIWEITLEGEAAAAAKWAIGELVCVPALQRACSPSRKVNNSAYPPFAATAAYLVKAVHSNLSATVAQAGKYGHPDHGLGGQIMELPPGEADLLVKLAGLVPDDPTGSIASALPAAKVELTVNVTPRWNLARTA